MITAFVMLLSCMCNVVLYGGVRPWCAVASSYTACDACVKRHRSTVSTSHAVTTTQYRHSCTCCTADKHLPPRQWLWTSIWHRLHGVDIKVLPAVPVRCRCSKTDIAQPVHRVENVPGSSTEGRQAAGMPCQRCWACQQPCHSIQHHSLSTWPASDRVEDQPACSCRQAALESM